MHNYNDVLCTIVKTSSQEKPHVTNLRCTVTSRVFRESFTCVATYLVKLLIVVEAHGHVVLVGLHLLWSNPHHKDLVLSGQ